MSKLFIAVFVVVLVVVQIFYIHALYEVNKTCDGHVVKNIFDWPVCIK